jgi:microcystin-dependent protein
MQNIPDVPFLGEIRLYGGPKQLIPQGWALCDGSLLQVSDNRLLAQLLGATFGGDGTTTFGLPDLRGRAPVHADTDQGYPLGSAGGAEEVALTAQQFPSHSHTLTASTTVGMYNTPAGGLAAQTQAFQPYAEGEPGAALNQASLGSSEWQGQPYGSNSPSPHSNMQPYLGLNYIISLNGVYPDPNEEAP